jgi:hypothetical protein
VSVGGQLFEIEIKEGTSDTIQPNTSLSGEVKPPVQSIQPQVLDRPSAKSSASHIRKPLIQFLGPRKLLWKTQVGTTVVSTDAQPKTSTSANGITLIQYESLDQLPKKYQPIPFSDLEMQAIDVFFGFI